MKAWFLVVITTRLGKRREWCWFETRDEAEAVAAKLRDNRMDASVECATINASRDRVRNAATTPAIDRGDAQIDSGTE